MKLQPTQADAAVAQRLYNYTESPQDFTEHAERELRQLRGELVEHYRHTGMYRHQPTTARYRVLRGVYRACIAPIIHAIEIEHSKKVSEAQQGAIVPQKSLEPSYYDNFFRTYGTFHDREQSFLRAGAALIDETTRSFIGKVVNDKDHWCAPLWECYEHAYVNYEPSILTLYGDAELQRLGRHPIQRIRRLMIMSNVTVLNVLAPAAQHLPLWAGETGDGMQTLEERVPELSRWSSVNVSFLERYFPGQAKEDLSPARCPFEHDEARIAAYGIHNVRSIDEGPWPVRGHCPADVELQSPHYPEYGTTTAASIRLQTSIPIAAETLWADAS